MDLAFLNFHDASRATVQSISAAITRAVDAGVLAAGDKMPSSRELGLRLGVSRTTVVRAFDGLIARGYLSAIKGSGTTVADTVGAQAVRDFRPGKDREFSWSKHQSDQASLLKASNASAMEAADFDVMNNGAVPLHMLPVLEWQSVYSSICRNGIRSKLLDKNDVFGYAPLRAAIAKFLRRSKAIICHPDQIVLYSGPQAGLAHIAQLMVAPGHVAVCENPGYPGVREQFRIHGAEVVAIPVDEDGVTPDVLDNVGPRADWLYVTPSCQDPTGAILTEQRRKELLEWCRKNNTAIIEDAWDSDLRFGGCASPTLFSMDPNGCVIYLYNFGRLLYPLSTLGIVVLPESLVPLFRGSKHLCDRQFPTLEQIVLTEIIDQGNFEKYMRNLWKTYRVRRQSLIFALKRRLTDRVDIMAYAAGMQFLVHFNGEWTKAQILEASAAAGLPLAPTDSYYFELDAGNEFMVNFGAIDKDDAEMVVDKFASILEEMPDAVIEDAGEDE
jgi:GntR family transcriptional regulator/MocR family aminotransferase